MSYVDWLIKGPKIGGCSCSYGCPCEFNALPTRGWCEGLEAHLIEEGHFGDVRLDGLIVGARYRWPGAVHEGLGTVQGFMDERANAEQREALGRILGGQEQEPTTVFNIYGSTVETELEPIFAALTFNCDFETRHASFEVPGIVEFETSPIRNPVTGAPHHAQIVLPDGFEFTAAEAVSARFCAEGDIAMKHVGVYGALTYVAYGPYGIIREQSRLPTMASCK
ncbi:MAG: DUF1326 domain-containing protein [Hyphomicrobiaceae bacterium]